MCNQIVDIIRGFAMLLVVLGHTLSGSTSAYGDSFLFQVIWTLQMPLFIIISGYVTRYSRPIVNTSSLWQFIKKRTLAYLFPWVVWTVIVRALILGQTHYLDFKYLFWHMDSGYWFLITIWTLSMIFGVSGYLSNRISSQKVNNAICRLAFCCVGMILLAGIGLVLGLSFFSIKFTLYYFPIYLVGYLYSEVQEWLQAKKNFNLLKNCCITVSMALWLALITRFDFYEGGDNGLFIMGRFVTSMLGCFSVISLFLSGPPLLRKMCWVGTHSLEIYLTHYLFLNLIKMTEIPALVTLSGTVMLFINYVITLLLTVITIAYFKRTIYSTTYYTASKHPIRHKRTSNFLKWISVHSRGLFNSCFFAMYPEIFRGSKNVFYRKLVVDNSKFCNNHTIKLPLHPCY